ncbi:MAG: type IV pilus secretin PilQ [Mariprofundaceae bacterium]
MKTLNRWMLGVSAAVAGSVLAAMFAIPLVMAESEADRSVVSVIEGEELTIPTHAAASQPVESASGTQLTSITARDRGSVTEVSIRGRNMDASYNAFLLEGGKAMVVDLWGAGSKLDKDHFGFSTQHVTGVTVGDAGGRVRLVINLAARQDVMHQIEASDNALVVRFGQIVPKKRQGVLTVESVDFTPDDRIAHIIVRTDSTSPVVNLHEENERVFIDVHKAQLAAGLERSLDVSAFPGPIRQMDSYEVDGKVRIVARLRDKVRVSSFQEGNVLTVTLAPEDLALAKARGEADDKFAYVGQKVTFDFKNIEVQNALKLIGEVSRLNIIMSDEVSGNLTMRLVDVPWDQALDLILLSQGLDKQTVGNVVRVAPVEVLRNEYAAKIEARKGSAQLEPLITEFITLSYARVDDVKKMFESAASNATKGGVTTLNQAGLSTTSSAETTIGILSSRGSFLVDVRTNTLIIKDTEESINNVKRLIATIDKPVQQVLIEARIVEATDSFQRDLGIRWGGTYSTRGNRIFSVGPAGNTTAANIDKLKDSSNPPIDHGFIVDLPAASAGVGGALGLSIARLGSAAVLDLELSAAEAEGDIKIVSNPRVITTNLKKAIISQGAKVSFETVSQDGTKTEFIDAVLRLEVTPQITADNHVIMQVVVSKDNATLNITGDGTNIDTKSIETEIFMADGDTVVIGGIFTRNTSKAESGVPGLSKIPLFGWLFKKKRVQDDKTELLIFLTPKVVKAASNGSSI